MNNAIATKDQFSALDLAQPGDQAKVFVASGFFSDAKSASQAMVKILAGRELGIGSVAAMSGIDIMDERGRKSLRMRSNLLAGLVKASDKYSYRVLESDSGHCKIEFRERTELGQKWAEMDFLGYGEFDEEARERARLSLESKNGYPTTWAKFPQNMHFARALSNGVNMHCPDIGKGVRIYTEGDFPDTANGGPLRDAPQGRTSELDAALEEPETIKAETIKAETVETNKPEISEEAAEWFGEERASEEGEGS